ncbi:Transcription factor BTF3-like protein 4 [Trichoplax sp. H2]|uniref:Transcription factor BTF3 n=1 Tax=Trichoplax adhaerens TaxID=10228 RepID=B3S3N5_TRIAD|nr:expressed hypothetical protein [Trichoplax adhaerens]EDV22309.1 expressed hypothetical protein [Trichoplax adhaerens]RDD42215.1 Transcription factor BTF3-like protein 4 [Trichoplax sp. H2]|eukprot:XP_002114853.1 expressed hypothetical protein [Trichoplax adhaerens]
MNQEKVNKLQHQVRQVRIGGKGTPRRKKKVVHRSATTDDKKLQTTLKKIPVNQIPSIEEVNMIKSNDTVIHFANPKVQASLAANIFAISGHAENKTVAEMIPGILNQMGGDRLANLQHLVQKYVSAGENPKAPVEADDDVPDLVENFDEASKDEST